RPVSPADWASLYAAAKCSMLTSSQRIHGPLAMRSAIVAVHATGLRESDLFSLQWGHVHLAAECPVPGWSIKNDAGWLWLSEDNRRADALSCAGKTGKPHVIPMTRSLRQHVEAMRAMLTAPADTSYLLP